jgi:hypothetical protein
MFQQQQEDTTMMGSSVFYKVSADMLQAEQVDVSDVSELFGELVTGLPRFSRGELLLLEAAS